MRSRLRDEDGGASAVEYGLIVFAIAAIIAAVVFGLGGAIQGLFDTSCKTISSSTHTGDCGS